MMLHITKFIELCVRRLDLLDPVYEFGSYQVGNQPTLRGFFAKMAYIGSDIQDGQGVDLILDVMNIDLPDESVGTAVCCETLEHVTNPMKAIEELHRVLKPDGILLLSSVFNFPIHNWPSDYWRFTPAAFELLLSPFEHQIVDWNEKKKSPKSVVGIGFKGDQSGGGSFADDLNKVMTKTD